MKNEEKHIEALKLWLGEENIRWFKHLKGLTGTVFPVLKLNEKRKGMPVYPVWFRDGMSIRNFLREKFSELQKMDYGKFEDYTSELMEKIVK